MVGHPVRGCLNACQHQLTSLGSLSTLSLVTEWELKQDDGTPKPHFVSEVTLLYVVSDMEHPAENVTI